MALRKALDGWKSVRKAALESAPPDLESAYEGTEPVTVTLWLPHFVHEEIPEEVERCREEVLRLPLPTPPPRLGMTLWGRDE